MTDILTTALIQNTEQIQTWLMTVLASTGKECALRVAALIHDVPTLRLYRRPRPVERVRA